MPLPAFTAFALPDIPMVQSGDDITQLILNALTRANQSLQTGDVVVIASKIISKSEGQLVKLSDVEPSEEAQTLAEETRKDPRIVELVLRESNSVSRKSKGVLVVEHRLGFVSANAGIDQSNIQDGDTHALVLPKNPDESAAKIRDELQTSSGETVAVVITDTHGRPFRLGNVGIAIGVAGMFALKDMRGKKDLFGRPLAITQQGYADMVASAAHLLSGEGAEGLPVIIIRGLQYPQGDGLASHLNRPPENDLYR